MQGLKKMLMNNTSLSRGLFILLSLIMIILTYFLVSIQSQIGVDYWDIFVYLNNSLKMAGMGVGDMLYLSPLLPAITSLFFRAGMVSEVTLFTISGVFYIIGTLGLYLLLKIRFNELESLAGALSFATFTIVLAWAVSGALDVPAIALAIWALYFTLRAAKSDSRFYYLAFPVAMLAFLTRYTAGLIIIPMLLFIYMNSPQKPDLKKILGGIIVGCIIYVPFMWYFYRQVGELFPFFQQFSGSASGAVSSLNPGYSLDNLYYLKNIPNYISSQASTDYINIIVPSQSEPTLLSYLILGLIILGLLIGLIKLIRRSLDYLKINGDNKKAFYIKTLAVLVLAFLLLFTYSKLSYVFSEVLMIGLVLAIYIMLRDLKLEYLDFDLLFFTWFAASLLMHSFHPVKVDRYFITMAPALAYGVALGINQVSSLVKYKYRDINLTSLALSLVLVLALISSTAAYMTHMPDEVTRVQSETQAAQWLAQYDPDYQNKTIASNRGPAFGWYLKKYVFTRISEKVTPQVFEELIQEINPEYYIFSETTYTLNLEGYHEIKRVGTVTIYQKD